MEKIKSFADLQKRRDAVQSVMKLRELGDNMDNVIQIKVAMGTCGIAAGAKQTMEALVNECEKRNVTAIIMQTGCIGRCNAEPNVEVKKPGKEGIVFDKVTADKVAELVEKEIMGK